MYFKKQHFFSPKTAFFSLLVMACIFMSGIAEARTYNAVSFVMTPGSEMSTLNFSWYSTTRTNSLVQVALKADMQGTSFPVAAATSYYCIVRNAATGYYSNKAQATYLSTATEYVYRLGDGNGNWSANYFFNTYQPDQFSFIAVGDPQIGAGGTTSDTNGWKNTLNRAVSQFPNPAFIISAGDQVETCNNESHFSGFFSPSQLKTIPLAPALGNHDNGAYNTDYHFNLPNLSGVYGITTPGLADYYYTYGNTLFIVLNTNNTSGASHASFINNAVNSNPGATWRIVTFHHDIYGSGYHALEVAVLNLRAALFPVFDQYNIDLVITGHDHSYTRTHVMRGDLPRASETDQDGNLLNPAGTIYFTLNSASGSKYYSLNASQASYVANRSQVNVPTFSYVTIDGNHLTFNTYRTDTLAVIDSCSIIKDLYAAAVNSKESSYPAAYTGYYAFITNYSSMKKNMENFYVPFYDRWKTIAW